MFNPSDFFIFNNFFFSSNLVFFISFFCTYAQYNSFVETENIWRQIPKYKTVWNFKHTYRSGVSNSVSYAGHILTTKWLAGRIKRKNVSTGRNTRLKVPLYCKKTVVSAIIWVILMMSRAACLRHLILIL